MLINRAIDVPRLGKSEVVTISAQALTSLAVAGRETSLLTVLRKLARASASKRRAGTL